MVEFEAIVLSTMLVGSIAPLIVVAIASAAFANEVEDRTLANLTLTPLPRWQIVALALTDTVQPVQIGLMTLADRPLTPAGQAFADAVINRARQLVLAPSDNQN